MSQTVQSQWSHESSRRRGWLRAAGEVGLVFLVFFVHAAWAVPDVNESQYLAKAKHYWQPEWCGGDFFLETPDAHVVFYWSFGWLTRWMPLVSFAWTGRIITWLLLAWAWRRVSAAITPRPLAAVLSAALFVVLLGRFDFAGEWVVGGLEAKGFAYVFVLLAIEALVCNRWRRVWPLLGAASAFHVLVGGWSVVAAGFAWLVAGKRRTPLVAMIPALILGLLLSLLGVLPGLALSRGVDEAVASEAHRIYVFERLPHHLAPHALRPGEMAKRLGRACSLVLAFAILVGLNGRSRRLRRLCGFVSGATLIALVGLCICSFTEVDSPPAAAWLRLYWFRLFDAAITLGVAQLAVRWIASQWRRRPNWAALGLLCAVGFAGWHLVDVTMRRRADERAPADRKLADAADWRDACDWIVEHTPPDAVFLVPRQSQTFRWYTDRAEVVNQKDIPQNAAGIVEWWRRIGAIYRYRNDEGDLRWYGSLAERSPNELQALGEEFGATYLVAEADPPLQLPLVYQNASYAVYRLGGER